MATRKDFRVVTYVTRKQGLLLKAIAAINGETVSALVGRILISHAGTSDPSGAFKALNFLSAAIKTGKLPASLVSELQDADEGTEDVELED